MIVYLLSVVITCLLVIIGLALVNDVIVFNYPLLAQRCQPFSLTRRYIKDKAF